MFEGEEGFASEDAEKRSLIEQAASPLRITNPNTQQDQEMQRADSYEDNSAGNAPPTAVANVREISVRVTSDNELVESSTSQMQTSPRDPTDAGVITLRKRERKAWYVQLKALT